MGLSVGGFRLGGAATLILSGLAIARGVVHTRPTAPAFLRVTPILHGAVLAAVGAIDWVRVQHDLDAARRVLPAVTWSVGIGLWLIGLGAVLILAGGLGLHRARGRPDAGSGRDPDQPRRLKRFAVASRPSATTDSTASAASSISTSASSRSRLANGSRT